MSFQLFSEPRPSHGGLAAEGALNLLGRPDLDPLIVLVREAVQNSWDAHLGKGTVHVDIRLRTLPAKAVDLLRDDIMADLPPRGLFPDEGDPATEPEDVLRGESVRLLTITDRGTSGLGGPIRADRPAEIDEITDFVDLVFNIGQPRDKAQGAGTYGFGKTISYLVSNCRTVLIHTSTMFRGRVQQRMICAAIGRHYSYRRQNYTGRHWWGAVRDGVIEPVVGGPARRNAARLGLPEFDDGETGTTIAILDPDLGGRDPHDAMKLLADSLAWNFWPKMVPRAHGEDPPMRFTVSHEETAVNIPDPRLTPPFAAYVAALEAVRACDADPTAVGGYPTMHVNAIASRKPLKTLGWMAMHAVPVDPGAPPGMAPDAAGGAVDARPYHGPSHHIALMRRAELVVRYLPGPELPDRSLEWCGVFRTADETDDAFSRSEPPTHDDWKPAIVADRAEKRTVNVALREIKTHVEDTFGAKAARAVVSGEQSAAVVIADHLGDLMFNGPGSGASAVTRPPSGARHRATRGPEPTLRILSQWIEPGPGGSTVLYVKFGATGGLGALGVEVSARVTAASSDRATVEVDAPVGAPMPSVLDWEVDGARSEGTTVRLPADGVRSSLVRILQPDGTAVVVDLIPTDVGKVD